MMESANNFVYLKLADTIKN